MDEDPNQKKDDNKKDAEQLRSEFISNYMISSFYKKGQIKFFRDNAHSKLIIIDNKYFILGSMNVLSNAGQTYYNKNGWLVKKWNELAIKNSDIDDIQKLRKVFFDF